jgi:hypothetical protein
MGDGPGVWLVDVVRQPAIEATRRRRRGPIRTRIR